MENFAPSDKSEKQFFVRDLKPKDVIRSTFLVRSKSLCESRNAKPYLMMLLSDKTGEIDTRIWEDAESVAQTFQEGDVVAVAGKAHTFQNRLQLVVQHLSPIPPEEVNLTDYLRAADSNLEDLYAELISIFEGVKNPFVRELALSLLNDPEIARRYKLCPAAKTIHHAFIGGLLVHSMQLIRLVDAILPLYEDLDRDLLLFGAAFHDFGKIYELSYSGNFGYTDEGKLVGHMAIAISLIDRKIQTIPNFPQELEWHLKHLVLAHHGRLEYGSPKRPHTIEAQIVHHLDDMDSKINSIQTLMKNERNGSRWTAYHKPYDNYYFKPESYLVPDDKE